MSDHFTRGAGGERTLRDVADDAGLTASELGDALNGRPRRRDGTGPSRDTHAGLRRRRHATSSLPLEPDDWEARR